jgi:diacylglycerol kinase (ATP)
MLVEIINSAIEAAINQISINQHHASITAKDMGKAAVFIAIINAVLIWLLILF